MLNVVFSSNIYYNVSDRLDKAKIKIPYRIDKVTTCVYVTPPPIPCHKNAYFKKPIIFVVKYMLLNIRKME